MDHLLFITLLLKSVLLKEAPSLFFHLHFIIPPEYRKADCFLQNPAEKENISRMKERIMLYMRI